MTYAEVLQLAGLICLAFFLHDVEKQAIITNKYPHTFQRVVRIAMKTFQWSI